MMDALAAVQFAEKNGKVFDVIFMDPPYNNGFEKTILEYLEHSSVMYYNTIIVVEASLDTDFSYLEDSNLEVYRTKEYKTNKHVFIQKREGTN